MWETRSAFPTAMMIAAARSRLAAAAKIIGVCNMTPSACSVAATSCTRTAAFKVDVLRSIRPLSPAAIYRALTAGWVAGAAFDDLEEGPAKQRDWRPANPLFRR